MTHDEALTLARILHRPHSIIAEQWSYAINHPALRIKRFWELLNAN